MLLTLYIKLSALPPSKNPTTSTSKNDKVANCPISKKGDSTGNPPIHPNKKQTKTKTQAKMPKIGLKDALLMIAPLHI